MTQLPIMPVYVERLLGDTDHLSNEEMGAYTRLLLGGWLRGGVLDIADMPRLARTNAHRWPRLWARLRPFYTEIAPGKFSSLRQVDVLEKTHERRALNVARTQKAREVLARKNKRFLKTDRAPTAPVAEPVTAPVEPPVTVVYPNKERTLPIKQAESSFLGEPIAKEEPPLDAAQVERLASIGRAKVKPTEALVNSPIVKRGTGSSIFERLNAVTGDHDGT